MITPDRLASWRLDADLDARAGAPVGKALRAACDEIERLQADAADWHADYQRHANGVDEFLGELLKLLPGAEGSGMDAYDEIPRGIETLRADRDRAREMVAALEAENARIAELHSEYRIYDDCGHIEHAETDEGVQDIFDIGLVCEDGYMYTICRECCTDADGCQTEDCVSGHDHRQWLCATNTILRAAEAGEGA